MVGLHIGAHDEKKWFDYFKAFLKFKHRDLVNIIENYDSHSLHAVLPWLRGRRGHTGWPTVLPSYLYLSSILISPGGQQMPQNKKVSTMYIQKISFFFALKIKFPGYTYKHESAETKKIFKCYQLKFFLFLIT